MSPEAGVAFACLMPHPPIVVPGVGRGREKEAGCTVAAMRRLGRLLVARRPETLVVISPHAPRLRRAFGVWGGRRLRGSLAVFGAPEERIDLPRDEAFCCVLAEVAGERGVRLWEIEEEGLDHGTVVPLWFVTEAGWDGPAVVLSLNYPGDGGLEELGAVLRETSRRVGRRVAVLASGDMSHRLKPGAPGGYDPCGARFDAEFVRLLRGGQCDRIPELDPLLVENAGEDVVDSTRIALAAAAAPPGGQEVLSYEGPFGVGYCVAILFDRAGGSAGEGEPDWEAAEVLLAVARAGVAEALGATEGSGEEPAVSGVLARRSGVFVTLRNPDGSLRGCVGTVSPAAANLVEETRRSAVLAAVEDHRFDPVRLEEMPGLHFEVSVLEEPEEAVSRGELDPAVYGVIVEAADGRRALMLPGVEGLDTVEEQLAATRRKARIGPDEPVTMQRFRVRKFKE